MKLDIIDYNYFWNHKYAFIFRVFILTVFSIYFLRLFDVIELSKSFNIIFEVAYGLVLLIFLLDFFLFTRVGTLLIDETKLSINQNDTIKNINLESIKSIKISVANKNHYYLKFDTGTGILVEIKNKQLDELKQVFINNNITLADNSLTSKLKKWLNL